LEESQQEENIVLNKGPLPEQGFKIEGGFSSFFKKLPNFKGFRQ
jgi:hypothetical protein